jgi:hypothetical protein
VCPLFSTYLKKLSETLAIGFRKKYMIDINRCIVMRIKEAKEYTQIKKTPFLQFLYTTHYFNGWFCNWDIIYY